MLSGMKSLNGDYPGEDDRAFEEKGRHIEGDDEYFSHMVRMTNLIIRDIGKPTKAREVVSDRRR